MFVVMLCLLWICIEDIRDKRISIYKTGLLFLLNLIVKVIGIWKNSISFEETVMSILMGMMPGIFLLIVGFISHEMIGYGDGLVSLCMGISMGFWAIVDALCIAFFMTGIAAFGCEVNRKSDEKKRELAFLPFLAVGILLLFAWSIRGERRNII